MTSTHGTGLQISLMAALVVCVLSGCGGARSRYESHLQRGQEFLAAGNLDKANVEFRNAAQIEPQSAPALYFSGRVAEARKNIRDAYGFYQAAVDADASYTPAMAGAGKMLVFAGGARRAVGVVAPGLAAHPDDVDLLAVRAAANQQLGNKDAARADAERAVQLASTNENAVSVLAAILADTKAYPQAISLVSTAVGKSPASVELREVLTNLYLLSNQPVQAEQQMRKIIELRPLDLDPRSQLALHLVRVQNLDGAQRVLEDAVQAFSNDRQQSKLDAAKLLLVDFVVQKRSRELGEKTLRDFIAREPDNIDLRLGLGALLQRTGAASEALVVYQDIADRERTGPKGLIARDRMAAIQLAQGHSEAARKLLAEVLQKNPRDDDALVMRATLEMQQNDPTGAIGDLRAVLHDQPNSVALHRSLAAAYLSKGQSALAEESLRAAMQGAPNDVPVRVELARLLARTDRAAQAVTLLEETAKRLPGDVSVLEELTESYLAAGNLSAARSAAEELKSRQPQSAAAFYYAGVIAAQEKRLAEAAEAFSRASELNPRSWQPHRGLALVKLAQHDPEGAVGQYQAAVALAPAEPQLVADAAKVYEKQGRIDAAIAGYDGLYKGNPRMQQFAANNLAMLLVTYRKDQASLDRARDLTSSFTTSDNGSLLDTVGWVRFKRGEYQEALPALERAAERAPDSRMIRFHLGMDQLQLGLKDRARTNLEAALNGADSFQGAEEARTALATLKTRV